MSKSLRNTVIFTLLILIPGTNSYSAAKRFQRNIDFIDAVILGDCEKVKKELKSGIMPDVMKNRKSGKTGIMYASEAGDTELVRLLISYRADCNRRDSEGNTPLMYAVKSNRIKTAELLIGSGARPNTGNRMGETPLELASREGNTGIVRLLLDKAGRGDSGLALIAASRYGYTDIIKLLLKKNPPVTIKGREGMTALAAAVLGGHKEAVELLLKQGSDINMKQRHSKTPVMIAAGNGDLEMVKFLAERKADINRISRDNHSALFEAIESNIYNTVNLLLELKARVKIRDRNLETPMMRLAKMDTTPDIRIARLLLEKKAQINMKNRQGKTALMFAAGMGHREVVELLVEKGEEINARDRRRRSAVDYAALSGHTGIVNFLTGKGAGKPRVKMGVEKTGKAGKKTETEILHRAAELSNTSILIQLLEKDIDINSRDSDGSTPLIKAIKSGVPEKRLRETVEFLLDNLADADIIDNKNLTALDYASRRNYYGIVKLLIDNDAGIKGYDLFRCAVNNGDIKFAHYLAENKKFDINSALFTTDSYKAIKLLVECGADVNTTNSSNLTPLLFFSRQRRGWGYYRNTRIIEVLVNGGADINATDDRGKTALAYALSAKNEKFARFLTLKGALKKQ